MTNSSNEPSKDAREDHECVQHSHPVPPNELDRYSVDKDHHAEQDIARYIEIEARGETVQHVELVRREQVLGDNYEIWDVVTDKDRWWVITNLTNLYSQTHFPTLDYTLSFHIGLMMRLRSRQQRTDTTDPDPFDEVIRRGEQAQARHEGAIEAEDYQAVGVLLRECLLSLIAAARRRADLTSQAALPKDADFKAWIDLLISESLPGGTNKELRQHVKTMARQAWQLTNWLTHARNANRTASSIALESSQTVIGEVMQVVQAGRVGEREECPICNSRNMRTHFDPGIGEDGDYYMSCGYCDWTDHPGHE